MSENLDIQYYPLISNESKEDFSASGDIIRLGLSAVAKVGQSAVRNIIESREKEGKFQSFRISSSRQIRVS